MSEDKFVNEFVFVTDDRKLLILNHGKDKFSQHIKPSKLKPKLMMNIASQ